jgi:uncharacterized membrane protein YdbT with pleckstrin-like domain
MGRIRHWFWHLLVGMVQGCLILALAAAIFSVAGSLIITHALPKGYSFFLTLSIIVISGILGALATLVWRLSHIGDIVRVAEHVVQGRHDGESTRGT